MLRPAPAPCTAVFLYVCVSINVVHATVAMKQKGSDILGVETADHSGSSVALSSDGTILAIGAHKYDGPSGEDSGHVRVYQWADGSGSWNQTGHIVGEAAGDASGWPIALSSDGTILAIGARNNHGQGSNSGHVRVYEYKNDAWTKKGSDIDGKAAGDKSGRSVALSSDGTILAVGAHYAGTSDKINRGHVRVYQWFTDMWSQKGQDIDGEEADDESGWKVALSSNGMILAIGAVRNVGEHNKKAGHVRVYEYQNDAWTKKGSDIDGEEAEDMSGSSVALSSDGTVLAVGAHKNDGQQKDNSGHVRVYAWAAGELKWKQRGLDIDGEASNDWFGRSVALSSDGTILATGAHQNEAKGSLSGHVRMYEWAANKWTQIGSDLNGKAINDRFGYSLALSSDGTILASGAIGHDSHRGYVRVFEADPTTTTELSFTTGAGTTEPSFTTRMEEYGSTTGVTTSMEADGSTTGTAAGTTVPPGSCIQLSEQMIRKMRNKGVEPAPLC